MSLRAAVVCAGFVPAAFAASAAASIAIGVVGSGALVRFDPYSNDTPVLFGHGWSSQVYGFAIDADGVGWGINWAGQVGRYDMRSGDALPVGTLPSQGGWFKDMAWDPLGHRMLALHFQGGPDPLQIYELNTDGPFGWTRLGPISGFGILAHVTGMAVAPDGTITLGDQGNGMVWDLTPEGDGLHAVARPHLANNNSLDGLDYDPVTGELIGVSPVARIFPDGSSQQLRTVSYSLFDVAFYPVPTPSTAAVLISAALGTRRRRAV